MTTFELQTNPPLADTDLNALFTAAWPDHTPYSFAEQQRRSGGWIAARHRDRLVGYVNVVWDGGVHAFLLDTTVHPDFRRRGLGQQLVAAATDHARGLGAAWLHVDYEERLRPFYESCGFTHTAAGLIPLR